MACLSVLEASRSYGIPQNNLRYWLGNGLISSSIEVRGKRAVRVILEEDLERFLASRENHQDDHQQENQSGGYSGGEEVLQRFVLSLNHIQTQLDEKTQESHLLQYQLGEATGRLQEVELRLELTERLMREKDERIGLLTERLLEVSEWKREVAATREEVRRPWWRWPWAR